MRRDDQSGAEHGDYDAEVGKNHREKEPAAKAEKTSIHSQGREEGGKTIQAAESVAEAVPDTRRNYLDLTNLIRSIQRAEGYGDCFRALESCGEMNCCWRPYCLNQPSSIL